MKSIKFFLITAFGLIFVITLAANFLPSNSKNQSADNTSIKTTPAAAFNAQHGGQGRPEAELKIFYIGNYKQ
jgi:hypothetical protein